MACRIRDVSTGRLNPIRPIFLNDHTELLYFAAGSHLPVYKYFRLMSYLS